MPRVSRSQRTQNESMEVDETATTIDQSIVGDPQTITFTRCLLLNRKTTVEEITALYLQIFTEDPMAQNLQNVLRDVNESLQGCKIKIVSSRCEVSDKKYYLVIPTYFKPSLVWPNIMFNNEKMNFIKTLINEIIVSDVGLVSLERVIRKQESLASDEAKKVIQKLIDEDYLIEPKEGKYGLSVLAVNELEPYFHSSFKDVLKKCVFCKQIMYFGAFCQSCKNNGHTSSGHFSCLSKYRESMKNKSIKCPSCNEEWSQNRTLTIDELFDYKEEDDE